MMTATKTQQTTTVELEGDRVVVISRTFRAPPPIVFDAWTKPELVARWWAPKSHGVTVKSIEADVKPGGAYRYVLAHGEHDIVFYGEYLEVEPPKRLVYTSIFAPHPEAPTEIVVTFEAREGATYLVSRETYASAEARTAALESGMEHGMRETIDQLDELVAELAAS